MDPEPTLRVAGDGIVGGEFFPRSTGGLNGPVQNLGSCALSSNGLPMANLVACYWPPPPSAQK